MNILQRLRHLSFYALQGRCILCAGASQDQQDLCKSCKADLPWLKNACPYCAEPLPGAQVICGACLSTPVEFSATLCPLRYQYPVDKLIQQFKNNNHQSYGIVLAEILAEHISRNLPDDIISELVITPIPLHSVKQRSRGFNQSEIVAQEISMRLNRPVITKCLTRIRATGEQKSASRLERKNNVSQAFYAPSLPTKATILLVDDVITTGATVSSATHALMARGASSVIVTAVARTPTGRVN